MSNIFAVYKPKGISSYDVIRRLKKKFPGERIGHGGTLDPLAEGVLVIGVGKEATRQLQSVLKGTTKTYEAVIELGKISETDDAEGPIQVTNADNRPTNEDIINVLKLFEGNIQQRPPRYSAIKINGVPAYKRARRGEQFDIPKKQITIHSLEIIKYNYPFLSIKTEVSSGTYIRALARDIGTALGTGGYLKELKRVAVGYYTLTASKDIQTF